jgi:hypothetical protein
VPVRQVLANRIRSGPGIVARSPRGLLIPMRRDGAMTKDAHRVVKVKREHKLLGNSSYEPWGAFRIGDEVHARHEAGEL